MTRRYSSLEEDTSSSDFTISSSDLDFSVSGSESESESELGFDSDTSPEESRTLVQEFFEHFIDQEIAVQIEKGHLTALETIFRNEMRAYGSPLYSRSEKQAFKNTLDRILAPFEDSFSKARVCLLIRQFAYVALVDERLPVKHHPKFSNFLQSQLPIQLVHHNVNELGTVEVKYNKQTVGYFKAGVQRQQDENFLKNISKFLKGTMGLQDTLSIFSKSIPCRIAFEDIVTKDNKVIPKESEIVIPFRDERGDFYEKFISTHKNMDGEIRSVEGGLQPALPDWKCDVESDLNILILVSFVLLLGGRDLKNDGVKGNHTIIDFEEFLEKKCGDRGNSLPDLHIPFHTLFSNRKPSKQDWLDLLSYWNQVDEEMLKEFVEKQMQVHQESKVTGGQDANQCHCELDQDDREDYVVRKPTFSGNRLLSNEKMTYLLENLPRLVKAIERCAELENSMIVALIEKYDPLWKEHESGFKRIARAEPSLLEKYNQKDLNRVTLWFRSQNTLPSDLTGLIVCPQPKDESNVKLIKAVGLLSTISSDLENKENDVSSTYSCG